MKCNVTKEALLEARKKEGGNYRIVHEAPLVHGGMKYKCQSCGKEWFMNLEIGVEDFGENGRPHQPCPFCIMCECGGFAHDISGLLPLPDVRPLFPGMKYFAYDSSGKEYACGIKSIYKEGESDVKINRSID